MELIPLLLATLLKVCPPKEDITPCSCNDDGGRYVKVQCSRLRSLTALRSSLAALRGTSVFSLRITDMELSTWSVNSLRDVSVERLELYKVDVQDSSLESGQRHFRALGDSLKRLKVQGTLGKVVKVLKLKLDHLSNLQQVYIAYYRIPKLDDEWFSTGPQGLRQLQLRFNGIEEVGRNAFSRLSALQLLSLQGNNIRELRRSMLPEHTDSLLYLHLHENKLRDIPSDLFSGFTALKRLYISDNLLHSFEEKAFIDLLQSLTYLEFTGNQIECNKRLDWLCDAPGSLKVNGGCFDPKQRIKIRIQDHCKTV